MQNYKSEIRIIDNPESARKYMLDVIDSFNDAPQLKEFSDCHVVYQAAHMYMLGLEIDLEDCEKTIQEYGNNSVEIATQQNSKKVTQDLIVTAQIRENYYPAIRSYILARNRLKQALLNRRMNGNSSACVTNKTAI
jgi:hypothetical protein